MLASMSARNLMPLFVLVAVFSLFLSADATGSEAIYGNGYQVMAVRGADGNPRIPNADGNGNIVTTGPVCATTSQTVVSVGVAAVLVPATSLSGRKALRVCNSVENVGSPKVKCLLGATPAMGLANPGDVLAPGDCFPYAIDSTVSVRCISDTAGTAVTTFECS